MRFTLDPLQSCCSQEDGQHSAQDRHLGPSEEQGDIPSWQPLCPCSPAASAASGCHCLIGSLQQPHPGALGQPVSSKCCQPSLNKPKSTAASCTLYSLRLPFVWLILWQQPQLRALGQPLSTTTLSPALTLPSCTAVMLQPCSHCSPKLPCLECCLAAATAQLSLAASCST